MTTDTANLARVLIGDDDKDVHVLLEFLLKDYNIKFESAYRGVEVFRKLSSSEFDYALLDVRYGGGEYLDGLIILDLLRDLKLQTQIYLFTGYPLEAATYDKYKDMIQGIVLKDNNMENKLKEIFKDYLRNP